MKDPSTEQKQIVDSINEGYSVLVDSVAGSGKTTTNLWIAKSQSEKKILILTYNRRLRLETRDRLLRNDILNVDIHTYHSFAVYNFNKECFTDNALDKFLKSNKKFESMNEFSYDLIIIDEAQDMCELYFILLMHIIRLSKKKPEQLCVLGDVRQSIYEFKNSDERFLSRADEIFKKQFPRWKKHTLHETFRLSHEMVNFINKSVFKKEFMISHKKTRIKPKYLICDTFSNKRNSVIFDEVVALIKYRGYQPDEFFIIAPSVKNAKSPLRQLANKLVENGINIFVPVSDEEKLDDDLVKDKMVFSTFHQTKGLERKVVFVYAFDDSYFKMFEKSKSPWHCPNVLYVALTRASERLIIIHHYENNYIPFINQHNLNFHVELNAHKDIKIKKMPNKNKQSVCVTDIIRHISTNTLNKALSYLTLETIRNKDELINVPTKIKQSTTSENVAEINGIAIPAYYELKTKGVMSIFETLRLKNLVPSTHRKSYENQCLIDSDDESDDDSEVESPNDDSTENGIDFYENTQNDFDKVENLLKVATQWSALVSGYNHKVNQIQKYDWLSKVNLEKCMKRFDSLNISSNAEYEREFEAEDYTELCLRKLTGFIDCIDGENIYEFKCTSSIENEHIIQCALYMYLHHINLNNFALYGLKNKSYKYFVFNILTNEMIQIKANLEQLRMMVAEIFENKYMMKSLKISNQEFDSKMQKYLEKISNLK